MRRTRIHKTTCHPSAGWGPDFVSKVNEIISVFGE
jgi:hypothetical protein